MALTMIEQTFSLQDCFKQDAASAFINYSQELEWRAVLTSLARADTIVQFVKSKAN